MHHFTAVKGLLQHSIPDLMTLQLNWEVSVLTNSTCNWKGVRICPAKLTSGVDVPCQILMLFWAACQQANIVYIQNM